MRRALGRAAVVLATALLAGPAGAQATDPFALPPGISDGALFSCQDLTMSGTASANSDAATGGGGSTEQGHVRSNGNVKLTGSAIVHGNATAGPGKSVTTTGTSTVTGTRSSATQTLPCTPIDLVALKAALLQNNDNATIPRTSSNKNPLGGADGRAFTVSGADTITLPAGTFLFSSLSISGSAKVFISGPVRILSYGNVSISGNTRVNENGGAFNVRLWSSGAQSSITGSSLLRGFVYAPSGSFKVSGDSDLKGSAFGKSVDISGSSRVRRTVDDAPPTISITSPTAGTTVTGCSVAVTGQAADAEGPVTVSVNGTAASVAADGTFTVTAPLGGATPGVIVTTATDQAGNTATAQVQVELTQPSVALVSPLAGSLLGQRMVDFSGTVSDGATVTVNGTPATVSNGAWLLPGYDLGADGVKTVTIVATSCAGSVTLPVTLDVDTLAPVIAIDTPANGAHVSPPSITVAGTVADAHAVTVTVNGIPATVAAGRFQATGVPVVAGANTIVATATDPLGHTATASISATGDNPDNVPPVVSIDAPTLAAGGCLTAAPSWTVSGTCSDTDGQGHASRVSSVLLHVVRVDGTEGDYPTALAADGLSWSVADVDLGNADGTASVTATATDSAGNTGTVTRAYLIDTAPPTLSLTLDGAPFPGVADGDTPAQGEPVTPIGHSVTPVVAATDSGPGTAPEPVATLDGQPYTAGTPIETEAQHLLVALVTDCAGHTTTLHALFRIDVTPPVLTITSPTDGEAFPGCEIPVTGSATDTGTAVTLTLNSAPVTFQADGSFATTVTLAQASQGHIVADARDAAGNTTQKTVTVVVPPPVVTLVSPVPGSLVGQPIVNLTGSAGNASTVTVNGVPAVVAGGSWTLAGYDLGADGVKTLEMVGTSCGGSATTPVQLELDATPPTIAIDSPAPDAHIVGTTVAVTGPVSDAHLASVTVNGVAATIAGGRFSADAVPLVEGPNTLVATATDTLGHTATATVSVTAEAPDVTAPVVSIDQPASGACLAAGQPRTITGTLVEAHPATGQDGQPPAVQVEVHPVGGTALNLVATLDASGHSWSVTGVDLGSADGMASATVTATDQAGNTSRTSRTWRIDASTPAVAITLDGGAMPGAGGGETPPTGAQPALIGRAVAPRATVSDGAEGTPPEATLTLDGAPYAAGTSIASDGDHLIVAHATDCAGHAGAANAFFHIDLTAPTLHSTTPDEGATLGEGITAYSGVSDSDLASATLNGRAATVSQGSFSLSPYPWVEGDNTVEISLVDQAGNRTVATRHFTVHSAALRVEILESGLPIAAGASFLRAIAPIVRASDASASVAATLNSAPFASGTSIATTGSYTLRATATDSLGHTASATATFHVDVEAGPTITITAPVDGATVPGPTVDVAGAVGGNAPTVKVNGRSATVNGTSWAVSALPLTPDVVNDIVATAVDGAGRSATATVSVLVRSGGPKLVILEPVDGAITNRTKIDVAGTVLGGRSATADGTVTVAGHAVALDASGAFRALDVALAEGVNTIAASATDAQGRSGNASVHVTADLTPPSIAILADGQPITDGASFGHNVTVHVEITDNTPPALAPDVRLNGAPQAATQPSLDIPVSTGGGYVLDIVASDRAGNQTRIERSFSLDLAGCTISALDPAAGGSITGSTVTIRGSYGSAKAITIRVPVEGSTPQEFTASLADGTFVAGDVPLPALGANALEVVCTDVGGSQHTTPLPLMRLAEGDGPTIVITAPTAGAWLTGDTVAVTGTVSVAAATVTVNGVATTVTAQGDGGAFSIAAMPVVEGPGILAARATDAAGRAGRARVVVWRDATAPKIAITSPENKSHLGVPGSGPATVDVSGSVDISNEPNLASVTVSTATGSVAATVDPTTGSFLATGVPLSTAAGASTAQTITATARDTLGHAGTTTSDVYLDPSGPAVVLTAPPDLARFTDASAQVPVAGEAWGAEGSAVALNGAAIDPATLAWEDAGADGRRHVAFSATMAMPSSDGPFASVARVTDLAGSIAQARRLLYRDTTAPAVVELVPADGTTGVDGNSLLLVLFSEPVSAASLSASDGLTLVRVSTGETVVGQSAVAGSAAAFVPGAELVGGESYRLRAGTGVTDLSGLPLAAPAQSTFTVALSVSGSVPTVDPVPAVVCARQIHLTGHATPGATVRATDGSLSFSAFAGTDGAFDITLPLAANGYHLVHVRATTRDGAASREALVLLRVDCSAPTVESASFDRTGGVVTITFSEAIDPATATIGTSDAAIRLSDGSEGSGPVVGGTLTFADATTATVQLDTADNAWWRGLPVRLVVGPPAADLRGNPIAVAYETVFFPSGEGGLSGGFLFGEAYDDGSGRPFEGASARLFASSAALPGAVPEGAAATPLVDVTTDGRGRFTMAGSVAAGRYVLLLEKDGATRAVRRLALEPSAGAVPFDSRLTPLTAKAGTLDPSAGGTVSTASGLTFEAAPATLPGTSAIDVVLTPLSQQGLPELLPLGWTPLAAADVRLVADGAALPESTALAAGGVHVTLPLPAWLTSGDGVIAAAYRLASGVWVRQTGLEITTGTGGTLLARLPISAPGAVALVLPDTDPANRPAIPDEGSALLGSTLPGTIPALSATLTLDPAVVAPTGRATARVAVSSADNTTPWPSGLAVQAYLDERLVLSGGGELLEAPFSADLVLYRATASAEAGSPWQGGAEFHVSPSPKAAEVQLSVGWENVRVFPFPDQIERGQVLGPAGGSVDSPDGVELSLPEGALAEKTVVKAHLLSPSDLAALPALTGFDTLAGIRVELSGHTLARAATLSLVTPSGTPAEVAGDPRIVLGELVDSPADGRGALVRLAARTSRTAASEGVAERIVAAPEPIASALPLDGVVREGTYLVLRAQSPVGFATGFVRMPSGAPLEGSRATATGLGTADLSRLGGRYALVVPAGSNEQLQALHPTLDERGTATIASLAAADVAAVDITVQPVPPSIVSVSPPNGATDQPAGTPVVIHFSEPLDPASVTASTLTLQIAETSGQPSRTIIRAALSLTGGSTDLVLAPDFPLPAGHTYVAVFTGGVRDTTGTPYAGVVPYLWRFTTAAPVVPGQVHPEKFHIRIPSGGVAEIYGDPGALPLPQQGITPWAVSPEVEMDVVDTVRDTFLARADGSFTGTVGHPPGFPVTTASKVWVRVIDSTGAVATRFRLGPFATADGKGFIAPAGEAATFTTADGITAEVPDDAFGTPTTVTITTLPADSVGVDTPAGTSLAAYINVDFDGTAKDTLRLRIPAPADAADDAKVIIAAPMDVPWGRKLRILDIGGVLVENGQRYLSNDPSLQPEPATTQGTGSGTASAQQIKAKALDEGSTQTCQQAKTNGLSKCFFQSVFMELTASGNAAWFYGAGSEIGLVTGSVPDALSQQYAALYNFYADSFIFVAPPQNWNGHYVLPVLTNQPLNIVTRDIATGWIIAEHAFDPIQPGTDPFTDKGPLPGIHSNPPRLVDARPFDVITFAKPAKGLSEQLRLEIQAATDANDRLTLSPNPGLPFADGTHLTLYDMALLANPQANAKLLDLPVCGNGDNWSPQTVQGSNDMLLVVGPGDLDAVTLPSIDLQFDQSLDEGIADLKPAQLATLTDLGTLLPCPGQDDPRPVPFTFTLSGDSSRITITPAATLSAGHRFQLSLVASVLKSHDGTLTYPATAPTTFYFATRAELGAPVGSGQSGSPSLGDTDDARDLLQFGNLMLVGSATGHLIAYDTTDLSGLGKLTRYAVSNTSFDQLRAFATDGHNRLFFSALVGSSWRVKTARIEDVRAGSAPCQDQPDWAQGTHCFDLAPGAIYESFALGFNADLAATEWLALGTLPTGTPTAMQVLTQDEKDPNYTLDQFVAHYGGGAAGAPDARGMISVPITLSPKSADTSYAFQRVTVDNLSTGQNWSYDIPLPGGSIDATVTARKSDTLRVRYNVRAFGYLALMGSGITLLDLNRAYGVQTTAGSTLGQGGARLAQFQGQDIQFPACAYPGGSPNDGLAMTSGVAVHSATGCDDNGANCRGTGLIDVYSPLLHVGTVRSQFLASNPAEAACKPKTGCEPPDDPSCRICTSGGLHDVEIDTLVYHNTVSNPDAGADCKPYPTPVTLRDAVLANDMTWLDRGLRGTPAVPDQCPGGGTGCYTWAFTDVSGGKPPGQVKADLLFVSLGQAGVLAHDVSKRTTNGTVVGLLQVSGHAIYRLQVDQARHLLFAGGVDGSGRSIIDIWDIAAVNGAAGASYEPRPIITLQDVPWTTNHLAIDTTGTGLLYTWGGGSGPLAVPFSAPQLMFAGVHAVGTCSQSTPPEQCPTTTTLDPRLVPLGIPNDANGTGTAAFKLRVSLPGSLGDTVTARVQSMLALPSDRFLSQEYIGGFAPMPGGPGWPDTEVSVTLRRLGGEDASQGEAGRLATVYNLYESDETVVLVADPRARRDYTRQSSGGNADEATQCRNCDWPRNLLAANTVELLAGGPYVRAYLPTHPAPFDDANYPAPAGYLKLTGWADDVPSPIQASLAEPAQNPAFWSLGEAGVSTSLVAGEALLAATDYATRGRGLDVSFDRTYRSGTLGYNPLGSAGWHSTLFAHLRRIETPDGTGTLEIDYHDGTGSVWRFFPVVLPKGGPPTCPSGSELDSEKTYCAPPGLYLRLIDAECGGFKLTDRHNNAVHFDSRGSITEMSDRLRGGATDPDSRGNTIRLKHDFVGRLVAMEDDIGRRYSFAYHDDPRPKSEGGDGIEYGLLVSFADFVPAQRTLAFTYYPDRTLHTVGLPKIKTVAPEIGRKFEGDENRPRVSYTYTDGSAFGAAAPLHDELSRYRLKTYTQPGGNVPRVQLDYDTATGHATTVSFPSSSTGGTGGRATWAIAYEPGSAAPATKATLTAPWQKTLEQTITDGRTTETKRNDIETLKPGDGTPVSAGGIPLATLKTTFGYDGSGRLVTVGHADGSTTNLGYDGDTDRLARAFVKQVDRLKGTASAGTAGTLDSVTTKYTKGDDNLTAVVTDPESRVIDPLLVKAGAGSATAGFVTDSFTTSYTVDRFGRALTTTTSGQAPEASSTTFYPDRRNKVGGGFAKTIEASGFSASLSYDDKDNVSETTGVGVASKTTFDEWDRPVDETSGIGSGAYAGVNAETQRAYDAAGRLVRERDSQHDPGWVDTEYTYNERDQVITIRRAGIADPGQPGQMLLSLTQTDAFEYDGAGRLVTHRTFTSPEQDLSYTYDGASRVATVKSGSEATSGERGRGYDELGRLVLTTDGDTGIWRGRYDAWGNLYDENLPTGAHVSRSFDKAGGQTHVTVSAPGSVSREVDTSINSYGFLKEVKEYVSGGSSPSTIIQTTRTPDGSGRLKAIDRLDATTGHVRHDLTLDYEPNTGRLRLETDAASNTVEYKYESGPWATRAIATEPSSGGSPTVTAETRFEQRDAFGRVTHENRAGVMIDRSFDEAGNVLSIATGSANRTTARYDGRGLPLAIQRPDIHGQTLKAYDLTGGVLTSRVAREAQDSDVTSYTYDSAGRLASRTRPASAPESFAYNSDDTLATWTTRLRSTEGQPLVIRNLYDAGNRLTARYPANPAVFSDTTRPAGLAPLDGGVTYTYNDPLSPPTSIGRLDENGNPITSSRVDFLGYDSRGLPGQVRIGDPQAPRLMSKNYDGWGNVSSVLLPTGVAGSEAHPGYAFQYDNLDRPTLASESTASGEPLPGALLGATYGWGGVSRLTRTSTLGGHGFTHTLVPDTSSGRLASLAMAADGTPAGDFEYGWDVPRGLRTARSIGATDRIADLSSNLGWHADYDSVDRLTSLQAGQGNQSTYRTNGWAYGYGKADELSALTEEHGTADTFTTGPEGRPEHRTIPGGSSIDFVSDDEGRRIADDRFTYTYDWEGRIVAVAPKTTVGQLAPERVEYTYDGLGRLLTRTHKGAIPAGGTDDDRPFIDGRTYTWEGASLAAEAGLNFAGQPTWRRQYLPGPSGLDDAPQVRVEAGLQSGSPTTTVFDIVRDEMGSVIAVAEDRSSSGQSPRLLARFHTSPYGGTHVELGPELLEIQFDATIDHVGSQHQRPDQVDSDNVPGALVIRTTLPLDPASLTDGLLIEEKSGNESYHTSTRTDFTIGTNDDASVLLVMRTHGWLKGTSYQITLKPTITDGFGRTLRLPAEEASGVVVELPFGDDGSLTKDPKREFPLQPEEDAAANTLNGAFPGGINILHQGLWTDPTTGIAYARNRWYDPRNAAWLSEDPLGDVDSPNLYAFVGWQPSMATDPMGLGLHASDWFWILGDAYAHSMVPSWGNVQRAAGGVVAAGKFAAKTTAALASTLIDNSSPEAALSPGAMARNVQRVEAVTTTVQHPITTVATSWNNMTAKVEAHETAREHFSAGLEAGEWGAAAASTVVGTAEGGVAAVRAGAGVAGVVRSALSFDFLSDAAAAGVQEGAIQGVAQLTPRFELPSPPTVPRFARSQYGSAPSATRARVLAENPLCPYCGEAASTQLEHIVSLKRDWVQGGWADDLAARTARINAEENLTGACSSCNPSKGSRPLGEGPGEWWPPGWPSGTWWPFGGKR